MCYIPKCSWRIDESGYSVKYKRNEMCHAVISTCLTLNPPLLALCGVHRYLATLSHYFIPTTFSWRPPLIVSMTTVFHYTMAGTCSNTNPHAHVVSLSQPCGSCFGWRQMSCDICFAAEWGNGVKIPHGGAFIFCSLNLSNATGCGCWISVYALEMMASRNAGSVLW